MRDLVRSFGKIICALVIVLGGVEAYLVASPRKMEGLTYQMERAWVVSGFEEEAPTPKADIGTALTLIAAGIGLYFLIGE